MGLIYGLKIVFTNNRQTIDFKSLAPWKANITDDLVMAKL